MNSFLLEPRKKKEKNFSILLDHPFVMEWSIAGMRSMNNVHKEILWSSAAQMNTIVSLASDVYREDGVAMALMIVMTRFHPMN